MDCVKVAPVITDMVTVDYGGKRRLALWMRIVRMCPSDSVGKRCGSV